MTSTPDLLDLLSPGEAHLPPSQRTWARVLAGMILELRDPNDGTGDPDLATRYQYRVARGYAWRRLLAPMALSVPHDEAGRWQPCVPVGLIRQWCQAQQPGEPLRVPSRQPMPDQASRNPDGTGWRVMQCYRMPPVDPDDRWPDITTYAGLPPALCPVFGCPHPLMWDEAGRVPGARACTGGHLFALDHSPEWPETTLILLP